jgi:hypothetical protein
MDATTITHQHQGLTNAGPGIAHSPVAIPNDSLSREQAALEVVARIERAAGEPIGARDFVYTEALKFPEGVWRVWGETGTIALLIARLREGAHYPACVYGAHRAADVRDRPELGGMRLCNAHAATFNTQPLPQGAAA